MSNKNKYKHMIREALRRQDYHTPNYESENVLNERDFYPPPDNRVWETYIEDIDGGDNFADYCEYIFDIYEEEGYFD